MKQRSKCETCHHDLKWYDLVPIISFVILKGQCRYCRHKLSKLHVIGELCALLPIGLLVFNVIYPSSALFLALYLFLLVAALYDMHTHTIPVHFVLIFYYSCHSLSAKGVYNANWYCNFASHFIYTCTSCDRVRRHFNFHFTQSRLSLFFFPHDILYDFYYWWFIYDNVSFVHEA